MNKELFVKKMTEKLLNGESISNEDIMRGLLVLLDTPNETANDTPKADTKRIATAFYNAHKNDARNEIGVAWKELKKEVSYLEYTEVMSIINEIDDYYSRKIISAISTL